MVTGALLAAVALACVDGPTEPEPIASIAVTPANGTVASGGNVILSVTASDAGGRPLEGRLFTWVTTDVAIATVNAAGVVSAGQVRGAEPRSVIISATSEGKAGSASITVLPAPVARVVAPDSVAVVAGGTSMVAVSVEDALGGTLTGRVVSFVALDTTVVRVSGAGVVTAVAYAGPEVRSTRVIATAEGRSDTTRVVVTPLPVGTVTVTPDSVAVVAGGTATLSVLVRDVAGGALTGRAVGFTSLDTTVARVSGTGLVTAAPYLGAEVRSTRVITTAEGRADTSRIVVMPLAVGAVRVLGAPADSGLYVGNQLALSAAVTAADGTILSGRVLTWRSSDPSVIQVDAGGVAVARGVGMVSVSATSEGRDASVVLVSREAVRVPRVTAGAPVTAIALGGAVELTVPPGATTIDTLSLAPSRMALSDDRLVPGTAYDFGPSGLTFSTPISVAIRFDTAAVPAAQRSRLRLAFVESDGIREVPGGSVNLSTNQVSAEISHFSTYAIMRPDEVARMTTVSGGDQEATVGTVLALAPAVRVLDGRGRPIARERVAFRVASGGGALSDTASVVTDTAGLARLRGTWMLGSTVGPQTLVAAVVGTSVSTTITATGRAVPVSAVVVTPGVTSVALGGAVPFAAQVRDADGNTLTGRSVTWTTSDAATADITAAGVLTPRAEGRVTVTASSEGVKGTAVVTIVAAVAGVEIAPSTSVLEVGATRRLVAVARDSAGRILEGRPVTWSSSESTRATVTDSGVVTALAVGTVTIGATVGGRSGSAAVSVVAPVASITLASDSVEVLPGSVVRVPVIVRDASGGVLADRTLDWTSSNVSLLSVSTSGEVATATFVDGATRAALVVVASGRVADTLKVVVRPLPVAVVDVTAAATTILTGGNVPLTAVPRDSTGRVLTGRTTRWFTTDALVASVTAAGVLTAASYTSGETRGVEAVAVVEGRSGSLRVQIAPLPVATITVRGIPVDREMLVGSVRTFTAILRAADQTVLTGRALTWSSTAASVARVDADGVVQAAGAGVVDIRASVEGRTTSVGLTVRPFPEAAITITFDDGWRGVYDYAFPLLSELGFRGNIAWITDAYFDDRMTLDQLRTLQDAGWSVVSHSQTHPLLTTLATDSLRKEVRNSKARVTDVGFNSAVFVIPYLDYNTSVFTEVAAAGYKYARCCTIETWSPDTLMDWPIRDASRVRLTGVDASNYGGLVTTYNFRTAAGRDRLAVVLADAVARRKYIDVFFHNITLDDLPDLRLTLGIIARYRQHVVTFATLP